MNSRFLLNRSLKTRVTLFSLSIFVVSLWALSFYASRMLQEDMQRVLGEEQFQTASRAAAEINDHLTDRKTALEFIAKVCVRLSHLDFGVAAAGFIQLL